MNSKHSANTRMNLKTIAMMIALAASFLTAIATGQAEAQVAISLGDSAGHSTSGSVSDSAGWVESFDDAVEQSAATAKPIMFVFSGSDWCSYCQRLEQEILQTPEFESWSSANVIKVMVDFPQYHELAPRVAEQNKKLKQHFEPLLKGYPTILMVRSDGSIVGRLGYESGGPMAWIAKADSVLQESQHRWAETSIGNRQ